MPLAVVSIRVYTGLKCVLTKLIALFSISLSPCLANNNNNVNPFKSQQQLLNNVVNPFQANNNSTQQLQQQNLYGQLTLIPNGYGSSPLQGAAALGQQLLQPTSTTGSASFFNFNNNGFAVSQGLPNGCGFGSMQPTPVMAGGINGAYNNPFAVSCSLLNPQSPPCFAVLRHHILLSPNRLAAPSTPTTHFYEIQTRAEGRTNSCSLRSLVGWDVDRDQSK